MNALYSTILKNVRTEVYQERLAEEIPDNITILLGEEAWTDYTKEWERKGKNFANTPYYSNSSEYFYDPESLTMPYNFATSSASPATIEFIVSDTGSSPSSGSVTVQYEGVQVTTHYSTGMNAMQVANAISGNINLNSNIQVTAAVSGTTVFLTEKRDGCDFNGNLVSVSHTNGTHITVNNDSFYMSDGHDGDGWCEPNGGEVPPPPVVINVAGNSFINTNQFTGQVGMGSESIASQNIYKISVASRSYEDGWLIIALGDSKYSTNYVIAGVGTTKDPQAPSVFWQQFGEHLWEINPDDEIAWYATSYRWANF